MAARYVARGSNRYTGTPVYLAKTNPYRTETRDLRSALSFTDPEAAVKTFRVRGTNVDRDTIEAVAVERGADGVWMLKEVS